jgi:hypothetical protein
MSEQSLEALQKAAGELLYPSESDELFEPFQWDTTDELDAEKVEKLTRPTKSKKKRAVEEISFDNFFAGLQETDDASQFKKLQKSLQKFLKDLRVYRVGEVSIDVYIVGRDGEGKWSGLHTVSVET